MKLSVIIPYFQRESGILKRALESILRQNVAGLFVDIIVVDDGSPVSAQSEILDFVFAPPFHLKVIVQPNGGVTKARNTGLKAVDVATKYIAFLDSDDSWRDGHLQQGVTALEQGNDFYFCDNERAGVHASQFATGGLILGHAENAPDALVPIAKDDLVALIIRECPTQASTIIYRRDQAPDVLFDTSLHYAGEDKVFFAQLVSRMQRIVFSPRVMVDCGRGINMYFGHLSWDSDRHLNVVIDDLKAHYLIKRTITLSQKNQSYNNAYIARLRRKTVFLTLRQFVRSKGKWPAEVAALARSDQHFYAWFTLYAAQVAIGRALKLYMPT